MAVTKPLRDRLMALRAEFDQLRKGKENLLKLIDEAEIAEGVYNSNAIENSTLTLQQTEKVLHQEKLPSNLSVREIYEAKNLAQVMEYIEKRTVKELSIEHMLTLHKMLLSGIHDDYAGRFRKKGEYVRVGTHIAPPAEQVERMLEKMLIDYSSDQETYFTDKISRFHIEFERIHPFNDGNGRIGRVLMNEQFLELGYPPVIIRNKGKGVYYQSFADYAKRKNPKTMEKLVAQALIESLHKRTTYLRGEKIVTLTEFAKGKKRSIHTLLNAARRQTIPAFRERGVWKIGRPQNLITEEELLKYVKKGHEDLKLGRARVLHDPKDLLLDSLP